MSKNFTWRYFTAATLLCIFFVATFTTVNAQCDATTKPTFGYIFHGKHVFNINNGSVDPSESATLTICDGECYGTSGHFHSSSSNLYIIKNEVSGGGLLYDGGIDLTNSETVFTAAQLSGTAGRHTLSLVDPNVSGTLVQTVTPFTDANNNKTLDDGDCVGESILFTYTITPALTWYKDVDGDHHASETRRSCSCPGQGWTTTILPVDDCNDNDIHNSGPTFGFNFNGTAVANINNGAVDPGELANLKLCDGESYNTSGHFHSSFSNLYVVKNTVSGGTLVLNGIYGSVTLVNSETVLTTQQLSNTAGTYSFALANPAVGGVLIQKITPFTDANYNGIPDEGDCVGDPIVFTYTITPASTNRAHKEYSLSNSPNPFKGSSTIKYGLPVDSRVLIVVYDKTGRNLATLVNEDKKAGNYSVNFNAAGLGSGIYYYRLAAKSPRGRFERANKMVLVK